MKIGIPKEVLDGETRIAATPDTIKKLCKMGAEVFVQAEAGYGASISDLALEESGAIIVKDAAEVYGTADIILKVQRPIKIESQGIDEISMLRKDLVLIGLLSPYFNKDQVNEYAKRGVTAISMELIPRISRAQSMDALSSQSNIAGYKAVIEAANIFGRIFPMMMTAAGTVAPAKVLVLGAGVAGLQAIATARRLGASVSAFDVRPAAKEQVESLGAKFIEVNSNDKNEAETSGGYAREMSQEYKEQQRTVLHNSLVAQDICITTAQIPGKKAPVLITKEMVQQMKRGSVIADLAIDTGGNCELSEAGNIVDIDGVKIIGHKNWPALVPGDTSALYGRNLFNLLSLIVDSESKTLAIDWDDEIIKGALLTRNGSVVNPSLQEME
jgi:NAD(P) transhydrogenase subunit alpha